MSQTLLPPAWAEKLCDPYAVLGISVIADDRQIFKRYHTLAKLLHPDRHAKNCNPDQKLATAIFSHLINPAYQQLKHRQKRLIAIAMLRSDARVLEQKPLSSQSAIAQEIMKMSTPEAELFYEEAIACYAEAQYKSLDQFYQVTQQITILNLVYLRLHKPDLFLPQKAVPIISEVEVNQVELTLTDVKPVLTNYSQRHYQRAIEYVRLGKWTIAVQELRDAIKLEPNNSDYYALLGLVHLKQKFMGMARVYICQALKLNPKNSLALKYAPELKIQLGENTNPKSMAKAMSIAALLSRFTQRKGSQVKC
ncbi:DnaJ domain-containing protein [Nostoc sp. LEGE 12447]|uniref:J domain-containing protein n=1 Tax=Nostoc sp. LEGE 12447 TaxID=1828640 RepID=UPI0018839D6D|nr:DnaJ domain-containing protein [Nostoc sp. LEGE 12447]MBE8999831.1 DnaJ domain-containing protein [Nostoc sp. LEGE 12447]